jgi:hypothetical protein
MAFNPAGGLFFEWHLLMLKQGNTETSEHTKCKGATQTTYIFKRSPNQSQECIPQCIPQCVLSLWSSLSGRVRRRFGHHPEKSIWTGVLLVAARRVPTRKCMDMLALTQRILF